MHVLMLHRDDDESQSESRGSRTRGGRIFQLFCFGCASCEYGASTTAFRLPQGRSVPKLLKISSILRTLHFLRPCIFYFSCHLVVGACWLLARREACSIRLLGRVLQQRAPLLRLPVAICCGCMHLHQSVLKWHPFGRWSTSIPLQPLFRLAAP
jgi:hypothetical protein